MTFVCITKNHPPKYQLRYNQKKPQKQYHYKQAFTQNIVSNSLAGGLIGLIISVLYSYIKNQEENLLRNAIIGSILGAAGKNILSWLGFGNVEDSVEPRSNSEETSYARPLAYSTAASAASAALVPVARGAAVHGRELWDLRSHRNMLLRNLESASNLANTQINPQMRPVRSPRNIADIIIPTRSDTHRELLRAILLTPDTSDDVAAAIKRLADYIVEYQRNYPNATPEDIYNDIFSRFHVNRSSFDATFRNDILRRILPETFSEPQNITNIANNLDDLTVLRLLRSYAVERAEPSASGIITASLHPTRNVASTPGISISAALPSSSAMDRTRQLTTIIDELRRIAESEHAFRPRSPWYRKITIPTSTAGRAAGIMLPLAVFLATLAYQLNQMPQDIHMAKLDK